LPNESKSSVAGAMAMRASLGFRPHLHRNGGANARLLKLLRIPR
jgi:hypothetical protein